MTKTLEAQIARMHALREDLAACERELTELRRITARRLCELYGRGNLQTGRRELLNDLGVRAIAPTSGEKLRDLSARLAEAQARACPEDCNCERCR